MRLRVASASGLALYCAVAVTSLAQQGSKPRVKPKFEPAVQAIVDGTAIIPPEFAADILIRLAKSPRITEPSARVYLLRKAFARAASAEMSIRPDTMWKNSTGTLSGTIINLPQVDVYKLSLQASAIDAMFALDPSRARRLFSTVQFPKLPAVACTSSDSYDLTHLYQTAAKVSAPELPDEYALLLPFVNLTSHAQVRPAAFLLTKVDVTPNDLGQLANVYTAALLRLARSEGDERAFAVAANGHGVLSLPADIASLADHLERSGINPVRLTAAFRAYMVGNLDGVQCAEMVTGAALPGAVQDFNQQFEKLLPRAQLTPIRPEELKDARVGEAQMVTPMWASADERWFDEALKRLFNGWQTPVTAEEKKTPAWNEALDAALERFGNWRPDDEPPENVYYEKATLYGSFCEALPPGVKRHQMIAAAIQYFEENVGVREPELFLMPVNDMLRGIYARDELPYIIDQFEKSSDPTLSLYGQLEKVAPQDHRNAEEVVADWKKQKAEEEKKRQESEAHQ